MYEMYVETYGQDAQNQVNPAMFGKLVHLVFPDLGTRRLGTRGSARYHYNGICIKKSSFFYAQYCYLLGEKRYHSGDIAAFEKSTNYNSILQEEGACDSHSPIRMDPAGPPLSEFRRCPFWEQALAKKYSCTTVAFLADKYCGYCQDVLQNVRNQDLEKVEDSLTSFWKSLQQDTVMLMSLPDVCQLFKCYDVQLYKGIEDVLLRDFLEDVSLQYLKSVRLFSKKFKLWLLTALEGFPALLQISKLKDVTVFVKRLGRKIYLSNMAKTMRIVLKSSWRASTLKSDLHAIICQGTWDVLETAPQGSWSSADDPEENTEMKCSWHLFHLLLLEYMIHIIQSCLEKEEEDKDMGSLKDVLPDDQPPVPPDQEPFHRPDGSPAQEPEVLSADLPQVTLRHRSQDGCDPAGNSVVVRVPGFLVDTTTSNKELGTERLCDLAGPPSWGVEECTEPGFERPPPPVWLQNPRHPAGKKRIPEPGAR
nr:DNA-binding protein RFX8 isoform X4 [Vicugna pacos]